MKSRGLLHSASQQLTPRIPGVGGLISSTASLSSTGQQTPQPLPPRLQPTNAAAAREKLQQTGSTLSRQLFLTVGATASSTAGAPTP
ncbi:unnamed protein product, partial [Amoebophrya sp. A120]|eukprot:GSA120T00020305001.1